MGERLIIGPGGAGERETSKAGGPGGVYRGAIYDPDDEGRGADMSEKFGDELRDLSLVAESLVGLENVSMLAARLAALAKRADDLEAENDRLVRKDINGQFVVGQIESELALLRRAVKQLGEFYNQVTGVMSESHGVDGFHLNGDVAGWAELDFPMPDPNVLELIKKQKA